MVFGRRSTACSDGENRTRMLGPLMVPPSSSNTSEAFCSVLGHNVAFCGFSWIALPAKALGRVADKLLEDILLRRYFCFRAGTGLGNRARGDKLQQTFNESSSWKDLFRNPWWYGWGEMFVPLCHFIDTYDASPILIRFEVQSHWRCY